MQQRPDPPLRGGVFALDAAHVPTAPFRRDPVHVVLSQLQDNGTPPEAATSFFIRQLFFLRAPGANPPVHFRQLEFPEPSDAVGGHSVGLDPTVDRVADDPEMGGNVLDGRPRFNPRASWSELTSHYPLIIAQKRTKSYKS
jgi:hypothetical protein